MKNDVRLKRLKMLKYMLDNHQKIFPKIKFNMKSWAINNKAHSEPQCLLDGKCKTAACAVGSAMLYKPFNKMGLRARYVYSNAFESGEKPLTAFEPVYRGRTDWDAVNSFFGLEEEQSNHLFSPHRYKYNRATPKEVSARVKSYIKLFRKKYSKEVLDKVLI